MRLDIDTPGDEIRDPILALHVNLCSDRLYYRGLWKLQDFLDLGLAFAVAMMDILAVKRRPIVHHSDLLP